MKSSPEKPILTVKIEGAPCPIVVDPYNKRFKLIGWSAEDVARAGLAEIRARAGDATKGIVYAKRPEKTPFETLGFNYEAVIQGFFADGQDAHLFSCFLDAQRGRLRPNENAHECIRVSRTKARANAAIPAAMTSRRATPEDAAHLDEFLQPAFRDYPTPISEDYLYDALATGRTYFRICMLDGGIVGTASAEIDHENKNAEVSDCVTLPEFRGKGIVTAMIQEVERDVHSHYEIQDFYSLARAGETAMNCAFAKCGYRYTGRLVNNCRMPNGWESIHVWCRSYGS